MVKRAARTTKDTAIVRGSGNVFADLGFADADERQTKLRLAYELNEVLAERSLTQQQAARLLGLGHYKLEGFSVERLMMLLTALDRDIDIVIRKKRKSRTSGRITVVPA